MVSGGPRACLPPPRTYVAQHGAHVVGPRRAEGWGHCSHMLNHIHGHLWVILVALPSTKRNGFVNPTAMTRWRQATIVDSVTWGTSRGLCQHPVVGTHLSSPAQSPAPHPQPNSSLAKRPHLPPR